MGEELTDGILFFTVENGEFKKMGKIAGPTTIVIDRDFGEREYYETKATVSWSGDFTMSYDFKGNRKARRKRAQELYKLIFGVTFVEGYFPKKKKRSRKRVKKNSQKLHS